MNDNPLKNIYYISIPKEIKFSDDIPIDPKILLPVEINEENGVADITNLSWEMIIAGILKIFAYKPDDENIEYYRRLLTVLQPNLLNEMIQVAAFKADKKEYPIAEELLLALAHYEPEDVILLENLALLYERWGDNYNKINNTKLAENYHDKAYKYYSEVAKKNIYGENFHYNFGTFLFKKENYKKAQYHLEEYKKIGKNKKQKKNVKELLTVLYRKNYLNELFASSFDNMRLGKEDQAIKDIKLFLKEENRLWDAWFILGWAYRKKGMYQKALESYNKAIELEAEDVELFNEISICLIGLRKYNDAKKYLLKAIKIEPENVTFLYNLGFACFKNNNKKEALTYFKKVLEKEPNNKDAKGYISLLQKGSF